MANTQAQLQECSSKVRGHEWDLQNEELLQTMDEHTEMEGAVYDKQIQIRTLSEDYAIVIEVEWVWDG